MASNTINIHKLQTAINGKGYKLLYSTSQFYSKQQDRPVTVYCLKQAVWDEDKKQHRSVELFKSTSQIQMVLYLRDLWYAINGWEVPDDNPVWNDKKKAYFSKENGEK